MIEKFRVGELVRDVLNDHSGAYGMGIVVKLAEASSYNPHSREYDADQTSPGKAYDVYFTRFEKVITFHEDYLEKV